MERISKKMLNRWLCIVLTVILVISTNTVNTYAETKQEYFPENSIVEIDEELGAGDEMFPDGSQSIFYNDEDMNSGEDEIIIPPNSDSSFVSDHDDLNNSEDFPKGSVSTPEDDELNAGGFDENDLEMGEDSQINGSTDDELNAGSPSISLSRSSISIGKGNTTSVTVSYSGYSGSVYLKYARTNTSLCSAYWGSWSGSSIPLSICGDNAGSGEIYIYLKRASDNATLCSARIFVSVTGTAYLSASTTSLSITKGSAKSITMSYGGYSGNVYMQYGTTNSTAYSCKWGSWSNSSIPLTVSGANVGSGTITVYLKDATTGNTLATKSISVTVTATAKISLSASSISLSPGASSTIKVTYSNYSGTVYMQYGTTNSTAYSCKWGSWSGSTVPLTISGNCSGSGIVYIYLKDAKTNAALATVSLKVYVVQNSRVTASQTSVAVNAGSSATVKFTASNYSGTVYLQYGTTNQTAYSCKWGSWSGSTIPLTISGKNAGSGSITVYLKRSSDNATLAQVTISVTVKTIQAPVIKSSTDSVTVYTGNSVTVPITYSNVSSDIYYQYSTTNTSAYSCKWGSWLNSTNPLTITGKNVGTGTITVYLKRSADNVTLASTRISVTVKTANSKIQQLSYKFDNFSGNAPLSVCQYMFGNNQVAQIVFDKKVGEHGNCFGMASSSDLFYVPENGVNVYSYANSKSLISQLDETDRNSSNGLTVRQFVQAMQIAQVSKRMERSPISVSQLGNLITNVNSQVISGYPVIINVYGDHNGKRSGHAVIAYGTETVSNTHSRLLIYDSNNPLVTKYLNIYKDSSGKYISWNYELWTGLTWGSDTNNGTISYTNYSTCQNLWNNRGQLTLPLLDMVFVNSNDYEVYDINDNKIAYVSDGMLFTDEKNIDLVDYCGVKQGIDPLDYSILYLPTDLYTIKNKDNSVDEFEVDMVNIDLGVQVTTTGDEVTICADDSCNLSSALLDLEEGETYKISLMSSREGEPANIECEGVSEGDIISVMMDNGELTTCNADNADLTVGDANGANKPISHEIVVTAGDHGRVDSNEIDVVLHEASRTYKIIPDEGYEIDKVIVDGKNVGAPETYTFEKVITNHTLEASFKKIAEIKPNSPEIVSVYSTVQNSAKVTWKKVEGADGYQIYRSTSPDNGFSCIKTITNGHTINYTNTGLIVGQTYYYKVRVFKLSSSNERVYSDFSDVRYMPAAVVFDNVYPNLTTRIRIIWKEVGGANGYQIWRSDSLNGTYKIVKTITSGTTTAYSNTGLEPGKTYYYKMRAYEDYNGGKVFGTYSDIFAVATLPDTPTIIVKSTTTGKVTLSWNRINGATGYQIWRSTSQNGSYSIVKSITDGSIISYSNSGLTSGVKYYYKVRAYIDVEGRRVFSGYTTVEAVTVK